MSFDCDARANLQGSYGVRQGGLSAQAWRSCVEELQGKLEVRSGLCLSLLRMAVRRREALAAAAAECVESGQA